jgi:hypothetical protein
VQEAIFKKSAISQKSDILTSHLEIFEILTLKYFGFYNREIMIYYKIISNFPVKSYLIQLHEDL